MSVFRRLYGHLRRYRAWALIAIVSMMMFAATQTTLMALVQPLFDDVLSPPQLQKVKAPDTSVKQRFTDVILKRNVPQGQRGALINFYDNVQDRWHHWWNAGGQREDKWRRILGLMMVIFVVRALAGFFSEYSFQKVGLSTVRDLRDELYERIINQSHRFFAERSTGEMVSRLVSDADAIQAAVSTRMGDLIEESMTLLGLIVYVFINNAQLAFICFFGAPVIVYPIAHFGRRLRKTTHRSQERMADLATILEETIRGVRIVKSFTMEKFEIGRFRAATRRHLDSTLKAQRIQATTSPVLELLAGICFLLLFWYAHNRIVVKHTLTMGQFLAFVAAMAAMWAPVKKLNRVNLSVNNALAAAERVFRMLDIENEVREKPDAVALTGVGEGIRYEDVTFSYDTVPSIPEEGQARVPVLHNIDLAIAPGEIVALVGSSGAGKTTFVNLLPRFYDVSEGRITIDGVDVREATLRSLRGLMGFVTQEVVLFNDTVRNNVAYGRADADLDKVIAAAKAANAHDFVMALPNGYDTLIGEGGVLLSGGQRQRLAIARALFKDPPILVLDEATSSLDTESERLVQQALNNLMQGRTTLVIAHRLSTIRSADKIVVLDKGSIAEAGRHEELLARRGVYRKLYDLQFAEEDRAAEALA
jgi:subfamily B ATP-binding cassette protein MsbA